MMATKTAAERHYMHLMYLFGSFKPSERAALLSAATDNRHAFMRALDVFLSKWAEASWLEEYNVERVGEWTAAKCPPEIVETAIKSAESKLALANAEDAASVYVRTYKAFLTGTTAREPAAA